MDQTTCELSELDGESISRITQERLYPTSFVASSETGQRRRIPVRNKEESIDAFKVTVIQDRGRMTNVSDFTTRQENKPEGCQKSPITLHTVKQDDVYDSFHVEGKTYNEELMDETSEQLIGKRKRIKIDPKSETLGRKGDTTHVTPLSVDEGSRIFDHCLLERFRSLYRMMTQIWIPFIIFSIKSLQRTKHQKSNKNIINFKNLSMKNGCEDVLDGLIS